LIVHLLHYIPERRGAQFDVLEDVIPLHEVGVSVRVPGKVKAVTCVPGGPALAFETRGERVELELPKLNGYQIICLDLA
ncbi:MAG: beta-galactosidase, partial [Gemmatimonadota bacterium]